MSQLWWYVCLLAVYANGNPTAETLLRKYILVDNAYDNTLRPMNSTTQMLIQKNIELQYIIDLDERNQFLFSRYYHRWKWFDERLAWDPANYDNITSIRALPTEIWVPDIIIYNDLRTEVVDVSEYRVLVTSDGFAMWNFPVLVKSACRLSVRYFPYDQQVCPIVYGSSVYTEDQLLLANTTAHGSYYSSKAKEHHGEFSIQSINVRHRRKKYSCCPKYFSVLTYYIVVKRKALFTIYNIILPSIVVTIMTLLSFLLPTDSNEKVAVGMTSIVSIFWFLLLIEEWLPQQSDTVPLISAFFISIIILLTISLGVTICIINLFLRGQHGNKFPIYLEVFIFKGLGRILRMQHLIHMLERERIIILNCHKELDERIHDATEKAFVFTKVKSIGLNLTDDSSPTTTTKFSDSVDGGNEQLTKDTKVDKSTNRLAVKVERSKFKSDLGGEIPDPENETFLQKYELQEYRNMIKNVKLILSRIEIFEDLADYSGVTTFIEAQWKVAAKIIDRFFFYVFLLISIIIVCSTLFMFPGYELTEKDFI